MTRRGSSQPITDSTVRNIEGKRRPGRPRVFEPTAVLDHAVRSFWERGYEGTDVDSIAKAVGATKPSLYRLFDDKESLFLAALERYAATISSRALTAFRDEPEIADAVVAYLETAVRESTMEGRPTGCLIASIASGCAETSPKVKEFYGRGIDSLVEHLSARFTHEARTGRIPTIPSALVRARMLVDVTQGLALRARAGSSRHELLRDARGYAAIVLS